MINKAAAVILNITDIIGGFSLAAAMFFITNSELTNAKSKQEMTQHEMLQKDCTRLVDVRIK